LFSDKVCGPWWSTLESWRPTGEPLYLLHLVRQCVKSSRRERDRNS